MMQGESCVRLAGLQLSGVFGLCFPCLFLSSLLAFPLTYCAQSILISAFVQGLVHDIFVVSVNPLADVLSSSVCAHPCAHTMPLLACWRYQCAMPTAFHINALFF